MASNIGEEMSEKSQLEQDLLEQHCRGMIDQIQQLLPRDALVDGQADNCTVAAVDGRDALDNLLLSIIDASVSNMADSSSWHVELNIVPSQRWVYFRNDRATIREQG